MQKVLLFYEQRHSELRTVASPLKGEKVVLKAVNHFKRIIFESCSNQKLY